jgi:subtilisin family serine protease
MSLTFATRAVAFEYERASNPAAEQVHTQYGSFDLQRDDLPQLHESPHQAAHREPSLGRQADAMSRQLLQYDGPIEAAQRAGLRAMGVEVIGYVPQNTLLVLADAAQVIWMRAQPHVRAVAPQPAVMKLAPELSRVRRSLLRSVADSAQQTYVVELEDIKYHNLIAQAVERLGGQVVRGRPSSHFLRITATSRVVPMLLRLAQVNSVEVYRPRKLLNDHSYGIVQGAKPQEAKIWSHGLFGKGQRVGVCDTGVDIESCFFSGDKIAAYINYAEIDDYDGDVVEGHGTHVAGSIAGDRLANGRYDPYDGMAPAAQLVVQDVGNGRDLIGIPDDLGELFGDAYVKGVRIHANSWGGGDSSYDFIARSVDSFVAAHPDFLVFFAAGNYGEDGDSTVVSPATAKSVVAVAAVDGEHPAALATFSSRGPTEDDRIKPTLAAPGVGVWSAKRGASCDVAKLSGTSQATPTAAGAAALLREYFMTGYYPTGKPRRQDALMPSSALLRAMLLLGSVDLSDGGWGSFPGRGQGFGRLQLDQIMLFAEDDRRLHVVDNPLGLGHGETYPLEVTQQQKGPLKVVLTWTDPPGVAGSKQALVNDLDLLVRGPDGLFYVGNHVVRGATASQSTPAEEVFDRKNVEEVVVLPHALPGTYQVQVLGANVPLGPQSFALAVVGALGDEPR